MRAERWIGLPVTVQRSPAPKTPSMVLGVSRIGDYATFTRSQPGRVPGSASSLSGLDLGGALHDVDRHEAETSAGNDDRSHVAASRQHRILDGPLGPLIGQPYSVTVTSAPLTGSPKPSQTSHFEPVATHLRHPAACASDVKPGLDSPREGMCLRQLVATSHIVGNEFSALIFDSCSALNLLAVRPRQTMSWMPRRPDTISVRVHKTIPDTASFPFLSARLFMM
jgi:hypothetical protein